MPDSPQRIRIGHSPDPDDAFMFYALTSGAIDTGNRQYEHVLVDIDTLNEEAKNGTYEVSAVSIRSFPTISDRYSLMNCGASMGEGYGPMVISRRPMSADELGNVVVAVPGKSTSAYMTLRLALGELNVDEVPFDEILPKVLSGEYEAGVIIHEGQLTWKNEGAFLVIDLGIWWNEYTGLPLPLGGNVVRRDIGRSLSDEIAMDVRRSIEHALQNPELALDFARQWGLSLIHI